VTEIFLKAEEHTVKPLGFGATSKNFSSRLEFQKKYRVKKTHKN